MSSIRILFLTLLWFSAGAAPDSVNVNEGDLYIDDPLFSACDSSLPPMAKVSCEIQSVNLLDPPSIYDFANYPSVWTPAICNLFNVTLHNRVDLEEGMNFCKVPLRSADAFLVLAIGLLSASILLGKFSTVYVLLTGVALGVLNYYVNLLELGNAIAIWLSFRPGDLFLYAFLPPLIVDSALNIELYMFKKVFVHSIMMAVVMVILTAIILTPIILFVLGFQSQGWSWVYGAIFAAIIAPTDAIAVSSVLKKAHGPPILTAILEGESLLNDASGITLFEVFYEVIVKVVEGESNAYPSVWSVIPTILKDIVKLSSIGFGIGLGFSIISLYILKMIRWRGAGLHIEATYVLAMAYLSYYVTNAPAGGSGVIAVVTFGLFGNATSLWGMTGSSMKTGQFKAIWEMIAFAANGLVFFWAGLCAINFLIRSLSTNPQHAMDYVSILLIYIFMLLIRTFCIAIFNPIFKLAGRSLSISEICFLGWSGLRGAVSLILVTYISGSKVYFQSLPVYSDDGRVIDDGTGPSQQRNFEDAASNMALWTSCFVVFTLVINGPCVGPLLTYLRLNVVGVTSLRIQFQAKEHMFKHRKTLLENGEENEYFKGADWDAVDEYTDISDDLLEFGSIDGGDAKNYGIIQRIISLARLVFIGLPLKLWKGLTSALLSGKKEKLPAENAVGSSQISEEPVDLDRLMSECPYQSTMYDDEFFITVDVPTESNEDNVIADIKHSRWNRIHSVSKNIDQETLQEMRSRIIGGIQDTFVSQRKQGTISRDAFRILSGACNEEMDEPRDSIMIWERLLTTIKPGLITSFISKLALKGANHYRRYHKTWRRIFHYPHKIIAKIFMHYLSHQMLSGCEVALEYASALDQASKTKWLEIQGEGFVQLLSEIESESEKARSFILDRELEAPGTFRAIQSYRAAMVVLQGLEGFLKELASSGIIKPDEFEHVMDIIYKKSQRLELIGPVWKAAKVHQILERIKPFSGLPKEIFSMIWSIGTLEEYKPNAVICNETDDSVVYILLGVCKRMKIMGSESMDRYIAGGEASGLARALKLTPVSGKREVIALGNALGRGPLVFRLTRQDISRIFDKIARSESGLSGTLMDGWMKAAAITTFADLCEMDDMLDQLVSFLEESDVGDRSPRDDVLTRANFSGTVSLDSHCIESKDVSYLHAKQAAKKMLVCLRLRSDESEIRHLKKGELCSVSSTVILLRGTVTCEAKDETVSAPHVECWPGDFFNTEFPSVVPISWKVCSKDAIMFVYSKRTI